MQTHATTTLSHSKRTWLASATIALLAACTFAAAPQAQARGSLAVSVNVGPGPYAYPYGPVYYAPPPRYYYDPYYYPGYYYPSYYYRPYYHHHARVHHTHAAAAAASGTTHTAPPPLPRYTQPPIPGPGYVWTPGYWAWGVDDYYWVPGAWVYPPYVGALWTPGYWGWTDGVYVFYPGYWGLSVGYYGGIAYGFGYPGFGYDGGYWNLGVFYYNRPYNNFGNVTIVNVYNQPAATTTTTTASRASFNGPGGTTATPTAQQQRALANQTRTGPVNAQVRQQALASQDASLRATTNHGTPSTRATQRAGDSTNFKVSPAASRTLMQQGSPTLQSPRVQAQTRFDNRLASRSTIERNGSSVQRGSRFDNAPRMQGYPAGPRADSAARFTEPRQGPSGRAGQRMDRSPQDRRDHRG
jgi:hypothetical protein